VENELGILLMTMNLTKLAGILTKATANFSHKQLSNIKKNKKPTKNSINYRILGRFFYSWLVFSQPLFSHFKMNLF
jgi:hypothetical protein